METHQIIFKFDGRLADRHVMDPADYIDHSVAARQLLALHAYFFLNARFPKAGVLSQGEAYRVYAAGRHSGSLEGHWLVEFIAKESLKAGAGYLGKKAWQYTYDRFLKDSIAPILTRRPSSMPSEFRREPVLQPLDNRNTPFLDVEAEKTQLWGELRSRSTVILANAAKPVGRSASTMLILAATNDNECIGMIDEIILRRLQEDAFAYRQMQITAALNELGLRKYHPRA